MNVQPDFSKLAIIKEHFEGFKNISYADTGDVWTVGLGSTWNYDKQRKVRSGDIISRFTATRWMSVEVENVIKLANQYINQPLNMDQSAAVVDYIYNRGIGNFLATRLDELINSNPMDPRIKNEMIGTGLKDRAGHLLWGLGRRRRAEAYLYFTGQLKFEWPRWGIPI